jgi:ribokinase
MIVKASDPPHILVLGDLTVDIIGRVRRWPEPGDDCLARKLEMHVGGVGANCALSLALWKVPVKLVGSVGRDLFGAHVCKTIRENGVDVRSVQKQKSALTGMFYINVTPDGERTFFGSRGANELTRWISRPPLSRKTSALHVAGHSFLNRGPESVAMQLIKAVHARSGWVSLDVGMEPSKAIPRKILKIGRQVDILLLSLDEAAALTGTRDPYKAIAELRKVGPREVVLKFGKKGCLISQGSSTTMLVPSFKVRTVDSTGAGDAFVAAFLQARLRGWSAAEGAIAANAAGAVAATVVGAGENLPDANDVEALLRMHRLNGKWDAVRLSVLTRLRRRGTVLGRSK